MLSDQTGTSSYPESDFTYASSSSMMSDFGDAPLSSTRRSSFFNSSIVNASPSCHVLPREKRHTDVDFERRQSWNDSTSQWASEGVSILSSTRMSAAPPMAAMPGTERREPCTDDDLFASETDELAATAGGGTPAARVDVLPAFPSIRFSRKSVSFRDVDEYFPVFSPDSPKHQDVCIDDLPFDVSEYPNFLRLDRMVAVSQKQGIDVTSPDHVFTFCRESSDSTGEDMDKTVLNHYALEEKDDEKEDIQADEAQEQNTDQLACLGVGSSSSSNSGTGSSQYSSCDSDHYKSALDVSVQPKPLLLSVCDDQAKKYFLPVATQDLVSSKPGTLAPELNQPSIEDVASSPVDTLHDTRLDPPTDRAAEADDFDLTFTPSPFVTARTRSRQSRCSLRFSKTPESLHLSSLFEATLPTPVRTRRQTPRSQNKGSCYSAPRTPSYLPSDSVSFSEGEPVPASSQETQSSTLRTSSSAHTSQDDTIILPKSVTSDSQTLSDTVLLENRQGSSVDAYERNLAEVIKAMQGHNLPGDFLASDLSSSDEAPSKGSTKGSSGNGATDAWISEDLSSQPESVSSSSTSSCFSLTRSSGDYDFSCTPGTGCKPVTGCTPRYSMSRLSGLSRPRDAACLSYTPGGRPHTVGADEPVQYLYTDMEQGHKLVETHVPPTTNTSLSSSMSSTSSGGGAEETIIYDWRSMQSSVTGRREKENHTPPQKNAHCEVSSPDTTGMTDKELRLRLVELGESPGPISSRTRPTYMRRLCRLLQESKSQHLQKDPEQSQTSEAL